MSHVFPKWFFHQEQMPEGLIVRSQEQFDSLGKGWVDSPAKFFQAVVEPQIESQELQAEDVSEIPEFKLDLDEPKKPKRSRK